MKGFEVIGANTVNKDYYERLLKEKNENGIGLHEDSIEEIERKKDEDNPDYISIVLCSKGLGANYAKENQLTNMRKEGTLIVANKELSEKQ